MRIACVQHPYCTEVILNYPQGRNALDTDGWHALAETVRGVDRTLPLMFRGEGDHFCAGFDLKQWKTLDVNQRRDALQVMETALNQVLDHPHLTISRLTGAVWGGGLALALVTDWRQARLPMTIGLPMIRMGVTPPNSVQKTLRLLLGTRKTKWLLWRGHPIDGKELRQTDLVDDWVPDGPWGSIESDAADLVTNQSFFKTVRAGRPEKFLHDHYRVESES
ncbi:MAG: enoyl-CoA hydratase/isomerase family protein [Firmicutes bacterium]|nr:enoyl-CoA hydratase/isomerase family protein [Bacillota bacterium]